MDAFHFVELLLLITYALFLSGMQINLTFLFESKVLLRYL